MKRDLEFRYLNTDWFDPGRYGYDFPSLLVVFPGFYRPLSSDELFYFWLGYRVSLTLMGMMVNLHPQNVLLPKSSGYLTMENGVLPFSVFHSRTFPLLSNC